MITPFEQIVFSGNLHPFWEIFAKRGVFFMITPFEQIVFSGNLHPF